MKNQYKVDGRTYEAWSEMQCGDKQAHAPHSWNNEVMCFGPYFCKGVFTANEMNRDERIELPLCTFCGEPLSVNDGDTHRWMEVGCCYEFRKQDYALPASDPVNLLPVLQRIKDRTDREAVLVAALEQIAMYCKDHIEPGYECAMCLTESIADKALKEYRGER